jgi:ABC-2 type transport system ATP-binding protein
MASVINISNLSYSYTSNGKCVAALNDISFNVQKSEIFGFLGPNGAGKTTTIKLLLGFLKNTSGCLEIFGGSPSEASIRAKIGYMPEIADYYSYLSPEELLHFYGGIFGINKNVLKKRIEELLVLVDLKNASSRPIGALSKGMRQKVSFAQALINDPELLILDEPASGLDPLARKKMRGIIISLKERGKTILFSSHELSEVELISDTIAIMNQGNLVVKGSMDEVVKSKGESQTLENYFLEIIGA